LSDINNINIGGLLFNDNRLEKDLEKRCHMSYTSNAKVYRCCEIATHEIREFEYDYLYGNKDISRRFCNQHTIQLKISNEFTGKVFKKL